MSSNTTILHHDHRYHHNFPPPILLLSLAIIIITISPILLKYPLRLLLLLLLPSHSTPLRIFDFYYKESALHALVCMCLCLYTAKHNILSHLCFCRYYMHIAHNTHTRTHAYMKQTKQTHLHTLCPIFLFFFYNYNLTQRVIIILRYEYLSYSNASVYHIAMQVY